MARISCATKGIVDEKAAAGCFMCKWVLVGLERQGSAWALRDYGDTGIGGKLFPVKAQEYHIMQEKRDAPGV
jgi:hypothetical protein